MQDYFSWPEESFEEMDSTLAVQQYIQQLIRKDFTNIDDILKAPESQDEGVWKYEHLRYTNILWNNLWFGFLISPHNNTILKSI